MLERKIMEEKWKYMRWSGDGEQAGKEAEKEDDTINYLTLV